MLFNVTVEKTVNYKGLSWEQASKQIKSWSSMGYNVQVAKFVKPSERHVELKDLK